MLPLTTQSDKLLNSNILSASSCNNCAIVHFNQLQLPFSMNSFGAAMGGTRIETNVLIDVIVTSDERRFMFLVMIDAKKS
jgi:hypothetical protein